MNKLIIHQTFANGMTFDVSDNRNHGNPTAVVRGSGLWQSSFGYSAGNSRIDVLPSKSLNDLGAIRVTLRFYHSPTGGGGRRHNLVEGHRSFALFIQPDRSIKGTILDANLDWRGATSSPGVVAPNMWHQVEFTYDGMGMCQIMLDGAVVAAAYGILGPVRSVDHYGIALGHWPDPDPRYTLEGWIGEFQLYKYDPQKEIEQLLNPCCIDREAIDSIVADLQDDGWTGEKLGDIARDLLNTAAGAATAVRGNDPAETENHQRFAAQAMAAFVSGDTDGLQSAFKRLATQAATNLSPDQIKEFSDKAKRDIQKSPIQPEDVPKLAKAFCWDHGLIPDLDKVLGELKRSRGNEESGS